MLIVHLVVGVVLGALSAVAGVLMGASVWGGVGCYILGGNVGLCASMLATLLRPSARVPQLRPA